MNVLSLGDCDVVLDTQWLCTLGPIKWDFKKLVVEFSLGGKEILFTGLQPSGLTLQEADQFFKPVIKKGLLLQIISYHTPSTPVQQHGAITKLLNEFNKVFEVPIALPPLRGHEHQIVLKEDIELVCERPYRYPFYQKTEIEKIVHDLLEASYIRISYSPLSSPVLLVRKADGSWRVCIDYRSLNKAIVKDKYPIPVIDELLDELSGAMIFSKPDLRSSYH